MAINYHKALRESGYAGRIDDYLSNLWGDAKACHLPNDSHLFGAGLYGGMMTLPDFRFPADWRMP